MKDSLFFQRLSPKKGSWWQSLTKMRFSEQNFEKSSSQTKDLHIASKQIWHVLAVWALWLGKHTGEGRVCTYQDLHVVPSSNREHRRLVRLVQEEENTKTKIREQRECFEKGLSHVCQKIKLKKTSKYIYIYNL